MGAKHRDHGAILIAGLDEAGRGCLAGPVIAAAVILDPESPIPGLQDSKRLTPQARERIAAMIMAKARAWSIGRADSSEIDARNVLRASLLAMSRALGGLDPRPDAVKVDGPYLPDLACPGEAIIGGDATVPEISAASILAKVARDREMCILDALYPGYGFSIHKGYPTVLHKASLRRFGPTPIHRCSFQPVKEWACAGVASVSGTE